MATFKIFDGTETNTTYFVGDTKDVKALYKTICRHNTWKCCATDIRPLYEDFPCFDERKLLYGLCIDEGGMMTVVNSDTVLAMVLDGEIVEI